MYIVLAVNLEGYKEVLGHWVSDGEEGASFWLGVVTNLCNRGRKTFSLPVSTDP